MNNTRKNRVNHGAQVRIMRKKNAQSSNSITNRRSGEIDEWRRRHSHHKPSNGGDGDGDSNHVMLISTVPSRVIHFRNVLPEITTDDIVQLCRPFGEVTHLLLLKNNQALVQFADLESAKQFIRTFGAKTIKPVSHGPKILLQKNALSKENVNARGLDANISTADDDDGAAADTKIEKGASPIALLDPTGTNEERDDGIIPLYELDNSLLTSIRGGVSQAQIRDIKLYPNFSSHKEMHKGAINERGSNEKQNHILLVTIFNAHPAISLDVLYERFVQYGNVDRIVMFNKAAGLQALIQFRKIEDAVRAHTEQQGKHLDLMGAVLSLQFSNLKELVVQQNERARDFTLDPYIADNHQYDNSFDDLSATLNESIESSISNMDILSNFNGLNISPDTSFFTQEASPWHSPKPPSNQALRDQMMERRVLLVSGFNDKEMDCTKLFNLFSCYGFVERIKIFHSKTDHAMIQFSTHQQAQLAMTSLKGVDVFGNRLCINYSRHTHINTMASAHGFNGDDNSLYGESTDSAKHNDLMHDYIGTNLNRFPRFPKRSMMPTIEAPSDLGISIAPFMHVPNDMHPDIHTSLLFPTPTVYDHGLMHSSGMSHPRVIVSITPESSPHRNSPSLSGYSPLTDSPLLFRNQYQQQQHYHHQNHNRSPIQHSPHYHGDFHEPLHQIHDQPPYMRQFPVPQILQSQLQQHLPFYPPQFQHQHQQQMPQQNPSSSPTRYMCPPTATIHVANIGHSRRAKLKDTDLKELFGRYGEIEAIKIFEHRQKPMALVRFAVLSDAVACLCSMHNQTIKGQTLKLAFSRNRMVSSCE